MKRFASTAAGALLAGCLAVAPGWAQQAAGAGAAPAAGFPAIYVGDFQPAQAPDSSGGPLHGLTSRLHTYRVDENAAKLSRALVNSLTTHGASADILPADVAPPTSGWIVRGVYYSLDSNQHLITVPSFISGGGDKGPDVEVTVTIADAAKDPDKPFAVIGNDAVLKGQGANLGFNPYVVAAKFAIHTVEGDQSIDALADQIAVKVLEQRGPGQGGGAPARP
jgi:hypothetical protein